MGERAPDGAHGCEPTEAAAEKRFLVFDFLESEVVLMDIQITIELFVLVISAIGLGIYIERKK